MKMKPVSATCKLGQSTESGDTQTKNAEDMKAEYPVYYLWQPGVWSQNQKDIIKMLFA